MTIGERIKEIRNHLGMSQVDFANKINVSKQTLYKYENNIITNIPFDKIEAIAQLGNVSPSYIMGWNKHPQKEHPDITVDDFIIEFSEKNEDRRLQRMVNLFYGLSDIGKKKALDNMEDLSQIYSTRAPILNAAHQRTDIEITDDIDTSDDDIMDSEDF